MKRIVIIKEKLCDIINNSKPEDMERLLYELQNTSIFESITINILSEFDEKYFSTQNDEEMSNIIKHGIYKEKLIKWVDENID